MVVQVSQGGGDDARWSPDGGQLFYRNGQAMMKVDVAGETPATWSRPVQLFCGGLLRRRPKGENGGAKIDHSATV